MNAVTTDAAPTEPSERDYFTDHSILRDPYAFFEDIQEWRVFRIFQRAPKQKQLESEGVVA